MPVNTEQPQLATQNGHAKNSLDVPLDYLDYKYVEKCEDVKELEKIYKVLLSGVEGKYPELERHVEDKIRKLAPNSRVIRKDLAAPTTHAISNDLKKSIEDDINNFVNSMPAMENKFRENRLETKKLPPVRSTPIEINDKKQSTTNGHHDSSKKEQRQSVKPRDYREWEKIEKNLEQHLEENDNENDDNNKVQKSAPVNNKNLPPEELKEHEKNMSDELRAFKAEQEKTKGNESFNAKSFDEALVYYTRSLSLLPNAAAFNNRALTYLKLEKWQNVIDDCTSALKLDNDNNFKAFLRRATAYFKLRRFTEAKKDIDKCMQLNNADPKAKELYKEIEQKFKQDQTERDQVKAQGGYRLQIEETDGEEEHSIPIAEVESDDDEYDDVAASPSKEEEEEEEPKLPQHIDELKDKANRFYSSGQYGDAVDTYTKAIEQLQSQLASTSFTNYFNSTLSILYNNRASSFQKTADYKSCIADCDAALALTTASGLVLKLIWKKANSYEMLEKYQQAFIAYEQLMRLDSTYKDVQQSYNRLKKLITQTAPKEQYDEHKNKGNECVKKNDYAKACEHYTQCVQLDADNVIGYLNRALCHVKLGHGDEAVVDCSFVLSKQIDNVKALYRRALAYRLKGELTLALKDLETLLSLESNNVTARKEYDEIKSELSKKKVLVEELHETKTTTTTQQPKKVVSSKLEMKQQKQEEVKTFGKINNAYEFLQAWNSISRQDINSCARLMTSLDATELHKYIGNKLDGDVLERIVKALFTLYQQHNVIQYLVSLTKAQRFSIVKMFMNNDIKRMVNEMIDNTTSKDDESLKNKLKKEYDL